MNDIVTPIFMIIDDMESKPTITLKEFIDLWCDKKVIQPFHNIFISKILEKPNE